MPTSKAPTDRVTWWEQVLTLPRATKQAVLLATDAALITLAVWIAHSLDRSELSALSSGLIMLAGIAAAASIPIFVAFGLYRAITRFIGPQIAVGVAIGSAIAALVIVVFANASGHVEFPLSAGLIFFALGTLFVGGSRLLMRQVAQVSQTRGAPVVIYGAGEAGARLAAALRAAQSHNPVAFVDDDVALHRKSILGLKVYSPESLQSLIDAHRVEAVLLALPSVSRRERQAVLERIQSLGVPVQTVPDITDILTGAARVEDIREVDVADLLGRDAVPPNQQLFDACIRGKVVLVTGAGGSIGSELCRQIVRQAPRRS
jgi:FlaA1/EpsC-like NDP-sugar epimerase